MKKFVKFEMQDGSVWKLPISVVENHRASCYKDDFDSLEESLEDTRELFSIDSNEITEWIECEMNWNDIKDHLVFIENNEELTPKQMWYASTKTVI